MLYPEVRQSRPANLDRSPVIGSDSPVQYEPSETPGIRQRMPVAAGVAESPAEPEQQPGGELPSSGLAFLRRLKRERD
jgi:hypothetical protein